MSILINNMNISKSCEDCELREMASRYSTFGPFNVCPYFDKDVSREITNSIKREDCPIVDVSKPHGRLIDENDVLNVIERFLGYLDEDIIYRIKYAITHHIPTVIEAEAENNDQ